jgi:toxin ParE1/3/4
MSITIHPELETRLRARAQAEGLSVEAYLERLVRADQSAEDELAALASAGLNSGDPIEPSKARRTASRHERAVSARYVLRPKADEDLDQQAYYLATEASPETGHRFLIAAHETFALLSTHPQMGRPLRLRHRGLPTLRMFRISGFDKMLVLYIPLSSGIEVVRVVHGSRDLVAFLRLEEL